MALGSLPVRTLKQTFVRICSASQLIVCLFVCCCCRLGVRVKVECYPSISCSHDRRRSLRLLLSPYEVSESESEKNNRELVKKAIIQQIKHTFAKLDSLKFGILEILDIDFTRYMSSLSLDFHDN